MKIKQKITTLILTLSSLVLIGSALTPSAYAACGQDTSGKEPKDVQTAIINCNAPGGKSAKDSAIWQILIIALNILTAGVGILAVGGIAYGAILYASAGDRADQTKQAIGIITNVVIGILAYGGMYLILNFLIPGGIFT